MKEIPLTQGQVALVDDEDYERVAQYKWYAAWQPHSQTFYAVRNGSAPNRKLILLHCFIMGHPVGLEIDHINHNGLDDQRGNLRRCTSVQQNQNTRKRRGNCSSRYKGVYWHKMAQRWVAQIVVNKKWQYLGCYTSESDAARAYNNKARELFGEFALVNEL